MSGQLSGVVDKCKTCGGDLPADMTKECPACFPAAEVVKLPVYVVDPNTIIFPGVVLTAEEILALRDHAASMYTTVPHVLSNEEILAFRDRAIPPPPVIGMGFEAMRFYSEILWPKEEEQSIRKLTPKETETYW